jgi:hypothetical protein
MIDNKFTNTLASFKDINRREVKREKKEERNILGSSLEKKINSVNKEIDKMKTDEILLNVDPEVDPIEAIEQIQNYYNLIKKEISKIVITKYQINNLINWIFWFYFKQKQNNFFIFY